MRYWELLAGVVFGVLGGWVWWLSSHFPPGQAGIPGPGFFPSLLGIAMVGLAIALVIAVVIRRGPWERPRFDAAIGRIVLVAAFIGLLILVWRYLRFEVASFAFLFILSSFFDPKPWKENLKFSLIVTIVMVLFFRYGLQVAL